MSAADGGDDALTASLVCMLGQNSTVRKGDSQLAGLVKSDNNFGGQLFS